MPSLSDESLMLAVARGDWAAFEQLVLRHQQAAWRIAYRMVADQQAAEDLAQEAFLRIFKAAGRYQQTAAFRTYLYRVVVHLCLDYLRKRRPTTGEDLSHVTGPTGPVDREAVLAERSRAVQRAVACLPPKQRSAVVLRYYEGLGSRDIADVMQTTPKAVERLLARASRLARSSCASARRAERCGRGYATPLTELTASCRAFLRRHDARG